MHESVCTLWNICNFNIAKSPWCCSAFWNDNSNFGNFPEPYEFDWLAPFVICFFFCQLKIRWHISLVYALTHECRRSTSVKEDMSWGWCVQYEQSPQDPTWEIWKSTHVHCGFSGTCSQLFHISSKLYPVEVWDLFSDTQKEFCVISVSFFSLLFTLFSWDFANLIQETNASSSSSKKGKIN